MDKVDEPKKDELSLRDILLKLRSYSKYLKSKWLILLICSIIGAILGFTYALFKKPVYIATSTFVLEENKGSGLSQYAGLASIAGINLGNSGGGVFEGDNIIELYTSRNMIVKTLLTEIALDNKKQLLINRYIDFLKLRSNWKTDKLNDINFQTPYDNFNRKQDSLLIAVVTDINKKVLIVNRPDQKLSIIDVTVKFGDEVFAKEFNDHLVATVNDFYIKTKTKKTALDVQILQRQADSVRSILNNSISGVASALDAAPNANPALLSLKVPSQRKQVDVQASSEIYAEIVKNLELSKISLRQETPLIQIIDNPLVPLQIDRFGKGKGILLGLLLGVVLAAGYLTVVKIYAIVMVKPCEDNN